MLQSDCNLLTFDTSLHHFVQGVLVMSFIIDLTRVGDAIDPFLPLPFQINIYLYRS